MIDENVLDNPIFSDTQENISDFYENIEQYLTEAGISYPDFVEFKTERERNSISWSEETGYTATGIDGTWESFADIYDHIHSLGHDACFEESALLSPQVSQPNLGADMVFLEVPKGKKHGRILIGAVNHRVIAVYSYYQFLKIAKAYIADPSDFLLAYSFLEGHPAFWTRKDPKNHRYEWDTSNGISSIWTHPTRDEEGKIVIMMEHGCSVPPSRVTRYHDPRLDVWAPTFEDAYIQLAAKVHTYFALDGSERKGIPYSKQKWEVEVEERLNEYKKPAGE